MKTNLLFIFICFISSLNFVKGEQNTLTSIEPSKIKLPTTTETTITLTFEKNVKVYPSMIGLVESNSKRVVGKYKVLEKKDDKKVVFTIPPSMKTVGAYLIQVIPEEENYISDINLYIYNDGGKITLEGKSSIDVINPTIIDYIKMTFNQEIFLGRLEIKRGENVIKYMIDSTNNHSIKLFDSDNKKYTTDITYTITDKIGEDKVEFKVNVKNDPAIEMQNRYSYYPSTNSEKKVIKVKIPNINKLIAIVGNKRTELTKKNEYYEYTPSSFNEIIKFEYQIDNNSNFYLLGIYAFAYTDIQTLLAFSLDSCFIKGIKPEITINSGFSDQIDFKVKFEKKDSQAIEPQINNNKYTFTLDDVGDYVFSINEKNDDTLLYSQTVTVTDFTIEKTYYTSSYREIEQFELPGATCGSKFILQKDDDKIPINCSKVNEKVLCDFQSFAIKKYGEYTFYQGKLLTEKKITIYKTLSDVNFNISIPPFPMANKENTIEITTDEFPLSDTVIVNLKKSQSSEPIQCKKDNVDDDKCKLEFNDNKISIKYKDTERYYIASIESGELIKSFSSNSYIVAPKTLNIGVSKNLFIFGTDEANKQITFMITPQISNDYTFDVEKISIHECAPENGKKHCEKIEGNYKCQCTANSITGTLSLTYDDSTVEISSKNINCVSYEITDSLTCMEIGSTKSASITVKSDKNDLTLNLNTGNTNKKMELQEGVDSGIYSYKATISGNDQTVQAILPISINEEVIKETVQFYKKIEITQDKFTLYDGIKQNIVLQFKQSINTNPITKIILKKDTGNVESTSCNNQNNLGIFFSCEIDLTSSSKEGSYSLLYSTSCDNDVDTKKTVTVIKKPKLIKSVNPTFLSDEEDKRDITIEYESDDTDFDSIESITLINVDNIQDQKQITVSKKTADSKSLTISPNKGNIYGKYFIQTNYKISSEIKRILSDNTKTLFFFEKDLEVKSSNIYILEKIELKDFIITFTNNNLSKYQISNIKIKDGNNLQFSVVNGNSIKIDTPEKISENKSIIITDSKTPAKEITISIVKGEKPTSITTNPSDIIYDSNQQKEIKVRFDKEVKTKVFSKIMTENEYELIFKDETCSANTDCSLYFVQGNIPQTFDHFKTTIKFYLVEDPTNVNYLSTSADTPLNVINKNKLPTKVISNPVYIKEGETSIKIKLNQPVNSIINSIIKINPPLNFDNSDDNDYLVIKNLDQTKLDGMSFTITIGDSPITVELKILKCKLPKYIYELNNLWGCYSCADLDSTKPFLNSDNSELEPKKCIKECLSTSFIVFNQCFSSCSSPSSSPFTFTEGNKCVIECSNGYGIMNEASTICVKCSDKKMQEVNHICVDGCPKGTLLSTDGKCYLPGDLYQTTTEDKCKTYNCDENGTEKCEVVDDKPKCVCKQDYFGILCDTEKEKTKEYVATTIDNLFPTFITQASDIKYDELDFRFKIKDVATIIENSPDIEITDNQHLLITTATDIIVDDFVDKNEAEEIILPNENLLDLIGLAVHSKMIKNDTEKLSDLVGKAAKINFKNAVIDPDFSNENSVSIASSFNYFSNQRWTNDPKSLSLYSKNAKKNNQTIIDFSPTIKKIFPSGSSSSKYMFVNLDIHPNITKIISNISSPSLRNLQEEKESLAINSNSALFKPYIIDDDGNKKEIFISDDEEYIVKFPPIEGIDMDKYVQYKSKGLDIYDPTDDAFLNSCYWNDELDYDLPQVYRKKQLYTGKTFKGDICTYQGLDLDLEYIIMKCQKGDIGKIGYSIVDQSLNLTSKEINHKDNLPIKCGSQISVHNNIAFWLFLILFTLFIVINIVMALIKFNIYDLLKNDKIESLENLNQFATVEMGEISPKREDIKVEVNPKQIKVDIQNTEKNNFVTLLKNNFKELHPLLTLYRSSAISPIIYTQWIFFYNIVNLFGFNALYFTEDMLEDRIEDEHRNNFGYPMKTEFEKIMASIATSVALTLIVRGIILVTYQQKEDLSNKIQSTKNEEEKKNIIVEFTNSYFIRRIIGMIFMLILEIFFWYYTIVFCGIYEHTQYGWFYSGLWSLFMNWVCFAPFYILIITALEFAGNLEGCTYYMKRFFIF